VTTGSPPPRPPPRPLPGAPAQGPLGGAGILVTRPARQAGAFARKVAAIGGVPVIFPAIAIAPPADPQPLARAHAALADYDLAFFVSANAAEFGAPPPGMWPAKVAVYAPGPGTAEALAALGIADARIPATTLDSAGLLALPELADVRGKRVAIFRGDTGRDELAAALVARGAEVDHVPCYARLKPSGTRGLDEAFAEGRIDAVTLTSSEGLDNLWSQVAPATRIRWAAVPTFVPHPRIAEHARAAGLAVVETAGGDAGLLAGLLEWASRSAAPVGG